MRRLTQSTDHPSEVRALNRVVLVLLLVYSVVMAGVMAINHVRITPDVFVVFLLIGAVLIGRGWAFIRDWLPFIVILLAWEAMRGLADNTNITVQSDAVIAVERALAFGSVPSVVLQNALYDPAKVGILDALCSIVYVGHFAFPLVVAFSLWLGNRRTYYRFAATLLLMSIVAFFIFMLVPVAPPRFAGQYGEALPVHDIAQETLQKLDIHVFLSWAYANMSGNDVAAFPSLHSAYPMLALLFVRKNVRAAALVGVYAAMVWFSVVYLGHHYVVDVIGGIVLAVAVYAAVIGTGLLETAFQRILGDRQHTDPEAATAG